MSWITLRSFLGASFTVLVLLLLTRALIVEPFQITTGSMAPVLKGIHRQCKCPNCGGLVVVGAPNADSPPDHYDVKCPQCGHSKLGLDQHVDLPGQRIIVDKVAFEWRTPRRWEVVVFRGPDENATPFVKRVVGLPGESIQVVDGSIHIDGRPLKMPSSVLSATRVLCAVKLVALPNGNQIPDAEDYWTYNGSKVNRIESLDFAHALDALNSQHRHVHYQSAGRHAIQSPYRLGLDEYFVLGDNSAVSDDSRFWPTPGVKASALIGPVLFPRLDSSE